VTASKGQRIARSRDFPDSETSTETIYKRSHFGKCASNQKVIDDDGDGEKKRPCVISEDKELRKVFIKTTQSVEQQKFIDCTMPSPACVEKAIDGI
jgi:hypothetical protein